MSVFLFSSIGVVLPIYIQMKNSKPFNKILLYSIITITFIYIFFGII